MDDMIKDISAEIDYILNVRWDYDYVKYIGKFYKCFGPFYSVFSLEVI